MSTRTIKQFFIARSASFLLASNKLAAIAINSIKWSYIGKFLRKFRYKYLHFKNWRAFSKNLDNGPGEIIAPENQKKILLATSIGAEMVCWRLEMLLGLQLKDAGHQVMQLICDGALTACQRCVLGSSISSKEAFLAYNTKELCSACFQASSRQAERAAIPVDNYSKWLSQADYDKAEAIVANLKQSEIKAYRRNEIPVGEHAFAGAVRFFARSDLTKERLANQILRQYLRSAILTEIVTRRIIKRNNIDKIIVNHGIYVPHGVVAAVARSLGVDVVVWNIAYRQKRFIFSHDETYHHSLMNEPEFEWNSFEFTENHDKQLNEYLNERWYGKSDWIHFQAENPEVDDNKIKRRLKIFDNKPNVILLTNVSWDAQLHYPTNIYGSMFEWLEHTINQFSALPHLRLIIRIHPAEVRGHVRSREPTFDFIRSRFPKLPSNILVVQPEEEVSTYAVANICCAALIYATKMGVELTSIGMHTIVAGEAWIRGKGLTVDVKSKEHYETVLKKLPFQEPMSPEQHTKARKYAYHFFFRRMIPIELFTSSAKWPPFDFPRDVCMSDINSDAGLNTITRGITDKAPFIFDASD